MAARKPGQNHSDDIVAVQKFFIPINVLCNIFVQLSVREMQDLLRQTSEQKSPREEDEKRTDSVERQHELAEEET